ncbi:MAG: PTS sugar transporter subunit IIA [Victivallales bacterium]|nr:PTS sugar transporter subunit IIA [Victivallales bacterium]
MEISKLLPNNHIILGLKGNTPEDIIKTLAQPLLDDHVISDLDAFTNAVLEREKIFTTQVKDNVAFPHAHADQVATIALVIGITGPEGLTFAPNTPNKCRLFFLIAVPSSAPELHLELLANLVDFVTSDKLDQVLTVKTRTQLKKLIAQY